MIRPAAPPPRPADPIPGISSIESTYLYALGGRIRPRTLGGSGRLLHAHPLPDALRPGRVQRANHDERDQGDGEQDPPHGDTSISSLNYRRITKLGRLAGCCTTGELAGARSGDRLQLEASCRPPSKDLRSAARRLVAVSARPLRAHSGHKRPDTRSWRNAAKRPAGMAFSLHISHFPPHRRTCCQTAEKPGGLELPGSNPGAPIGQTRWKRRFSRS